MTTKLVFFAWVRERVGHGSETRAIPAGVTTARELMTWLSEQGEEYAHAFEKSDAIRVAIDQVHADHDQSIRGASEIAFFPPVTGG
ncbi:MAG: molybdopterin converting factor subunit 1 [Alphaproteobacteria bacterium]|nr:molybdopterin converting factor subunit 1 [Alphaproteobacteria bacterium]